jgi:hypothetical protein
MLNKVFFRDFKKLYYRKYKPIFIILLSKLIYSLICSVKSMETQRKRVELKSNTFANDIIIEESYKAFKYFADTDKETFRM